VRPFDQLADFVGAAAARVHNRVGAAIEHFRRQRELPVGYADDAVGVTASAGQHQDRYRLRREREVLAVEPQAVDPPASEKFGHHRMGNVGLVAPEGLACGETGSKDAASKKHVGSSIRDFPYDHMPTTAVSSFDDCTAPLGVKGGVKPWRVAGEGLYSMAK